MIKTLPASAASRTLVIVLAGGAGTRSYPLTRYRAKPAIPFGARFRQVDIPLSNALNSGLKRIYVVVQSTPLSLVRHLEGYHNAVSQMTHEFVSLLMPEGTSKGYFESDVDSILKLRRTILQNPNFDYFVVIMADQIVKVDFRPLIAKCSQDDVDAVMVYNRASIKEAAKKLGVFKMNGHNQVLDIQEKPEEPWPTFDDPNTCFANLAMYIFCRAAFVDMVNGLLSSENKHANLTSTGIDWLVKNRNVIGHNLIDGATADLPAEELKFFSDVGTIPAYFETHQKMFDRPSAFNLYASSWPLLTPAQWPMSPPKIDQATIDGALIGCNVVVQDKTTLFHSVISDYGEVGTGSFLSRVIVLPNTKIGNSCQLKNLILDKDIMVPAGTVIDGNNPPSDVLQHSEVLLMMKKAKDIPENIPILSEGGVLVFHKGFKFSEWKK